MKKQIKAEVIADSINKKGSRVTSFVVTFPRIVLTELNTNRMLSRNFASSTAIPFEKMVKMVEEDPFIPIAWQKDHKGMQGVVYWQESEKREGMKHLTAISENIDNWLQARDNAVLQATSLANKGVTKQLCNKLLEPFMWHTVLITATEWDNFFNLGCPQYELFSENIPMQFKSKKDLLEYVHQVEASEFKSQYDNLSNLDWLSINKSGAEIHIQALAECMWDALNESTPKQLKSGEWHIPFGDNIDEEKLDTMIDINIVLMK